MTSTFVKNLTGSEMNFLFEKSKTLNIRVWTRLDENVYRPKTFYNYEITLRHGEEINGEELFDNELEKYRNSKTKKPSVSEAL